MKMERILCLVFSKEGKEKKTGKEKKKYREERGARSQCQ